MKQIESGKMAKAAKDSFFKYLDTELSKKEQVDIEYIEILLYNHFEAQGIEDEISEDEILQVAKEYVSTKNPNNMTAEEFRRKITKIGKAQLAKKYLSNDFTSTEEIKIVEDVLTKRGFDFTALEYVDVPSVADIAIEEIDKKAAEAVVEEVKVDSKPKVKRKTSTKKVRKTWTDENGKEITKSDLIHKLIRQNMQIFPKEINEKLLKCGFAKAYHSEIQRCRQNLGAIAPSKIDK